MGVDPEKWLQIVRGLAEQNSAVRVCLSSNPVEEGGRCVRVRVLALSDDNVTTLEAPGLTDLGEQLREGTGVQVLALAGELRLLARCTVTGQMRHALNETTRVDAVCLSAPMRVSSGQLRDFYRAPVGVGVDMSAVQLRLDPDDEPTIERAREAGIDPHERHKARLVNISSGGVGLVLVVDLALIPVFQIGAACYINAELTTMDDPLGLRGLVVHTHKMDNGDLYIGLAFIFDDPILQKQIEDQLQRLSVWLQRRSLKNER